VEVSSRLTHSRIQGRCSRFGHVTCIQVKFGRIKTKTKVPNVPLNEKRRWIIDLLTEDPGFCTDGDHLVPILFHVDMILSSLLCIGLIR
jgi:hypothetical protein